MNRKRRVLALVAGLGLIRGVVACSAVASSDDRQFRGVITLANAGATTAVAGPYVSVVDSLVVSISTSSGTQTIGQHLTPADSIVRLQVTLPAGSSTLSVRILSNNRTELFSGVATAFIDQDGFSVPVALVARRPVMLVAPDVAIGRVAVGIIISTTVTVHNRGLSDLVWSVKAVDPSFANCDPPCFVRPMSGRLPAGATETLTFGVNTFFPTTPPRTLAFVLTSAEGDATVRWRYP